MSERNFGTRQNTAGAFEDVRAPKQEIRAEAVHAVFPDSGQMVTTSGRYVDMSRTTIKVPEQRPV